MKFFTKKKLLSGGMYATFTVFIWEIVEIIFEYLLAIFVSSAVTFFIIKTLTTFAIVKATELASVPIGKGMMAFIKKIFYIKGENKVNTLKKVWNFIVSNKCSLGIIVSSVLMVLCGSSLIDVNSLPAISVKVEDAIPAIVQETDVIATETVYSKEAVIATETVYEVEPVYATETVYEVEPVYATETVYEVEPVYATKVTFIANEVLYEDDGLTVKYNVGDYVESIDIDKYIDKIDVYMTGDLIKEGVVKYNEGDLIKEGVVKYNEGDLIQEGVVLFNKGDIIEPAEILYNEGDIIIAKGTILEEEIPAKTFNLTPIIFWILMGGCVVLCGVFFENPQEFAKRIAEKLNLKQEKENIKIAKKELADEEKADAIKEQQKIAEAKTLKQEQERRIAIDKIKEQIKSNSI